MENLLDALIPGLVIVAYVISTIAGRMRTGQGESPVPQHQDGDEDAVSPEDAFGRLREALEGRHTQRPSPSSHHEGPARPERPIKAARSAVSAAPGAEYLPSPEGGFRKPPAASEPAPPPARKGFLNTGSRSNLRGHVVWREILGPPISARRRLRP